MLKNKEVVEKTQNGRALVTLLTLAFKKAICLLLQLQGLLGALSLWSVWRSVLATPLLLLFAAMPVLVQSSELHAELEVGD